MSESFGILIFPQAEELDFVGPWEMLTMWSKFAGARKIACSWRSQWSQCCAPKE